METTVSVVIPTTCDQARAANIRRAIDSVLSERSVQVELLVVVNGSRHNQQLMDDLGKIQGIRLLRLDEGNVSAARYHGLRNSKGQFFCFLDDDDEFLEGALSRRISLFKDGIDVVVTNGCVNSGRGDTRLVEADIANLINTDLCGTFLQCNWFASPASTFRRSALLEPLFDIRLRYFEWTYLFFSLIQKNVSMRFEDCLTYRIFENAPWSVSKSAEYMSSYTCFIEDELVPMKLPAAVKGELMKKYQRALNSLSIEELRTGHWRKACGAHLKCLARGGVQYLPYTRQLLLGIFRERGRR